MPSRIREQLILKKIWDVEVSVTFQPGEDGIPEESYVLLVGLNKEIELPEGGFTVPAGRQFTGWSVALGEQEPETKQPGDTVVITESAVITAQLEAPSFGTPDFVIPAATVTIGENAFEGMAATTVLVPLGCESIGAEAFKDCPNLSAIRIPGGCELGKNVFAGCELVYVFGTPGSSAEAYCQSHDNCMFVEDTQN